MKRQDYPCRSRNRAAVPMDSNAEGSTRLFPKIHLPQHFRLLSQQKPEGSTEMAGIYTSTVPKPPVIFAGSFVQGSTKNSNKPCHPTPLRPSSLTPRH